MGDNDLCSTKSPPAQSREPLRNISPIPMRSPQIRRKTPFVLRSDSEDDLPSPHASIFDAIYLSGESGDENFNGVDNVPINNSSQGILSDVSWSNDENSRQGGSSFPPTRLAEGTEFRYGNGTILDTITEQASFNSMHTLARSRSLDKMSVQSAFLHHKDSFVVAKRSRRKQAFSMSDLDFARLSSYHDACADIEGVKAAFSIDEIYAQPKIPLHAPPQRPATPPGMPSWTEHQNAPPRSGQSAAACRPNRVQRFLGLPASGLSFSSRVRLPNLIRRTSAGSATTGLRAPRYRPPRSVYGALNQHPFNNAPVAETAASPSRSRRSGQRVRFTPSTMARDSENNALRNAVELTSSSRMQSLDISDLTPQSVTGIKCPHKKGRKAALKLLKEIESSRQYARCSSNEYTSNNEALVSSTARPETALSIRETEMTTGLGITFELPSRPASASSQWPSTGIETSSRPLSVSSSAWLLPERSPSPDDTRRSPISPFPSPSRPPSSSTTASLKGDNFWCWKCKANTARKKLDQWRNKPAVRRSSEIMCFVCCGLEPEHYTNTTTSGATYSYDRATDSGVLAPRRVLLESIPVVNL